MGFINQLITGGPHIVPDVPFINLHVDIADAERMTFPFRTCWFAPPASGAWAISSCALGDQGPFYSKHLDSSEPLKIPWWIDCEKGDYTTWFTGDYFLAHSRETYQPTSIMRWDRGIFNGSSGGWLRNPAPVDRSVVNIPLFCLGFNMFLPHPFGGF